jgi:3-methylcrotonyl-CoA carboxylase alpha subunit
MIAKLIVHEATREAALDRLAAALDRTLLAGPRSNVAFLASLCRATEFRQGKVDTGFIDRNLAQLGAVPQVTDCGAAALGVASLLAGDSKRVMTDEESAEPPSPWAASDGFQLGGSRTLTVPVVIDGKNATATVTYGGDGMQVAVDGRPAVANARVFEADHEAFVLLNGHQTRVHIKDFATSAAQAGAGDGVIKAPMHGRVLEVLVGVGDEVAGGQRLAVIEAMKMEHTLRAPFAGTVTKVPVVAGAQVVEGAEIVVIGPPKAG